MAPLRTAGPWAAHLVPGEGRLRLRPHRRRAPARLPDSTRPPSTLAATNLWSFGFVNVAFRPSQILEGLDRNQLPTPPSAFRSLLAQPPLCTRGRTPLPLLRPVCMRVWGHSHPQHPRCPSSHSHHPLPPLPPCLPGSHPGPQLLPDRQGGAGCQQGGRPVCVHSRRPLPVLATNRRHLSDWPTSKGNLGEFSPKN